MKINSLIIYIIIFFISQILVEKNFLPKSFKNKNLFITILMGSGIMVLGVIIGILFKNTIVPISLTIFSSTLIAWKLRNNAMRMEKGEKI